MAQNNQVWRFKCEGCGLEVAQGSPSDLKTILLDTGEVINVNACSKCVVDIDKYIENQEKEQAAIDRAKPPKVLRDRPGGFPESIRQATIAAAEAPRGYQPQAEPLYPPPPPIQHIPAPSPVEQNLLNNLTLLMGELVKGQNDIKELLTAQRPRTATEIEAQIRSRAPLPFPVIGDDERPRPVQQNMPENFGQKRKRNRGRNRSR